MKHYRINKVAKPAGAVIKTKDILAKDHRDAIKAAREDKDCPVCDVLHQGEKVGSVM